MSYQPPRKVRIHPFYNAFNVDNTADEDKPISNPTKAYVDSEVGALETEMTTFYSTKAYVDTGDGALNNRIINITNTGALVDVGSSSATEVTYTFGDLPAYIRPAGVGLCTINLPAASASENGRTVSLILSGSSVLLRVVGGQNFRNNAIEVTSVSFATFVGKVWFIVRAGVWFRMDDYSSAENRSLITNLQAAVAALDVGVAALESKMDLVKNKAAPAEINGNVTYTAATLPYFGIVVGPPNTKILLPDPNAAGLQPGQIFRFITTNAGAVKIGVSSGTNIYLGATGAVEYTFPAGYMMYTVVLVPMGIRFWSIVTGY